MEHHFGALFWGYRVQDPVARYYPFADVEKDDAAELHAFRRVHRQREYSVAGRLRALYMVREDTPIEKRIPRRKSTIVRTSQDRDGAGIHRLVSDPPFDEIA